MTFGFTQDMTSGLLGPSPVTPIHPTQTLSLFIPPDFLWASNIAATGFALGLVESLVHLKQKLKCTLCICMRRRGVWQNQYLTTWGWDASETAKQTSRLKLPSACLYWIEMAVGKQWHSKLSPPHEKNVFGRMDHFNKRGRTLCTCLNWSVALFCSCYPHISLGCQTTAQLKCKIVLGLM